MRYLIITTGLPFLTDFFEPQNHFNPDPNLEMAVFDLINLKYTIDGYSWEDIPEDHL